MQNEQFQTLYDLERDNLQMIGEIEKFKNQIHKIEREKQEQFSDFHQSKELLENKIKSLEKSLTVADARFKS